MLRVPSVFWIRVSNLSGDCDLIQVLVLHRPIGLVCIIEHYGHCCLGHPSLPLLIDQLLQAVGPHLAGTHKTLSRCRTTLLTYVNLVSVALSRAHKLFYVCIKKMRLHSSWEYHSKQQER